MLSTDAAKVTIAASSGSAPWDPYEAELDELVPYIGNKILNNLMYKQTEQNKYKKEKSYQSH